MADSSVDKDQIFKEAKAWEYPFVDPRVKEKEGYTNALNKASDWKYEPPEPEEEIKPPTAEEIEAIRKEAYDEGFNEGKEEGLKKGHEEGLAQGLEEGRTQGHEEGLAQGLDEGAEQIAEQTEIWQKLNSTLHHPVEQVENELQRELVSLAVSLARSVIRHEVKTNEDVIFQAMSAGLKVLPIKEKTYQIRLNPEDIPLIRQHFSEAEIEKQNWVLVEAPELMRGGCDIITESNAVDVSVERRARDVLDTFLLEQGLSTEQPEESE